MKNLRIGLCVVSISTACLTGCASNTQSENTGVGAVTGAAAGGVAAGLMDGNPLAVGLSAIGGALIGGYIGHSADSSETTAANQTMSNNDKNMPYTWTNSRTGVTYRLTPTSNMITVNGNPNCRRYKAVAMVKGNKRTTHGVACLSNNGTWVMTRTR